MAEKVPKSTRLPKDEAELVEAYAEEHELTEADALRRLIRTGLEEQPELVTRTVDSMRMVYALQIALLFMLIGLEIV